MIKRHILLLLILAISLGSYLWYRQTPEQQIGRVVDQLLENIEHRKISTRRKIEVHESLAKVLAEKVDFSGIHYKGPFPVPIPSEPLTLEEVNTLVDFFHGMTSLCEITQGDRSIKIVGSKAQVYQTADILVAVGKDNQDKQTWELTFDLEKGEDWRIVAVRGNQS